MAFPGIVLYPQNRAEEGYNGRGQEVIPMAPHEAERYKIRSGAERANSRLKEDFGASNVMVKRHSKVTQHLMFGVIVLFADQLLRLLG